MLGGGRGGEEVLGIKTGRQRGRRVPCFVAVMRWMAFLLRATLRWCYEMAFSLECHVMRYH